MAKNNANLRQVAILVSALDRSMADVLLDQMSDNEAALVRSAVMELDEIKPAEQTRVLEDFLHDDQTKRLHVVGSDDVTFANTSSELSVKSQADNLSTAATSASMNPFHFLDGTDTSMLADLLKHEHPQTTAVVIAHLSAQPAANILTQLPRALQIDVLRRITGLEQMEPTILKEIELEMESTLKERLFSTTNRAAASRTVNAILQSVPDNQRQDLLAELAQENKNLPVQFASPPPAANSPVRDESTTASSEATPEYLLAFDDLEQLDNPSLAFVFQYVERSILLLALTGASTALLERVLAQLEPRNARRLRKHLAQPGPVRLADIDEAQAQIALIASQLITAGQLQPPACPRLALTV